MRVIIIILICARRAKQRYLRIHHNANYVSLYSHYTVSLLHSPSKAKVIAYKGRYSIMRMIALATIGCHIN